MQQHTEIRQLIDRVRTRWRAQRLFEASVRGALAAAGAIGVALLAVRWTTGSPLALAVIVGAALLLAAAALGRALWPLRRSPGDIQVARFIEEPAPSPEDRLLRPVGGSGSGRQGGTPFFRLLSGRPAPRGPDVGPQALFSCGPA